MLYVIATLTIQPGSLDEVVDAARPCLEATREEPGCISYDLNMDVTDNTRLVFVERWKNRAALEAHFNAPHLQAWREAGAPFITARKVEIVEDGKVEVL
ncbi:MAG: putative quinol monooxygenase [Rhizobiaceae bacterium]